jgi:hypothetical protein
MTIKLIVTNSFGDYQRGDWITDPKEIDDVRAGHNAANVVPVDVPEEFHDAPLAKAKS